MVCFTVMDHDVLTANDFAGEAFLALGNIPGVAEYTTSVDNFHGLKQMDLPLMQQHDRSKFHINPIKKNSSWHKKNHHQQHVVRAHFAHTDHPILQILETRIGDRTAQDFVRKQRDRLSS